MDVESARMIGSALAIGLGAIGPGVGIGLIGYGAMMAIGRNPDAKGSILSNMIISMAFAESVAIYALIMSIIIVFVI